MLRNELTFPPKSFLGQINQDSWDLLSSRWRTQLYKSGQFLINAEDDSRDVFFVLRGSAKATIYTDIGREVHLFPLAPAIVLVNFLHWTRAHVPHPLSPPRNVWPRALIRRIIFN